MTVSFVLSEGSFLPLLFTIATTLETFTLIFNDRHLRTCDGKSCEYITQSVSFFTFIIFFYYKFALVEITRQTFSSCCFVSFTLVAKWTSHVLTFSNILSEFCWGFFFGFFVSFYWLARASQVHASKIFWSIIERCSNEMKFKKEMNCLQGESGLWLQICSP